MFKKLLYNSFTIPLLYVLSFLIPKNKKLVLLGGGLGYKFIGNTKFFYLWLSKKKNISFTYYWITRNKNIYLDLKKRLFPVIYLYSLKGFMSILRAQLLIIEQSGQDIAGTTVLLGNYNIFDCFHGIALKDASLAALWKNPNLYNRFMKFLGEQEHKNYLGHLATSADNAKTAIHTISNNPRVYTLGYPRNDIFFNTRIHFYDYKNMLKFKKYKKILLYAPTFRDHENKNDPFTEEGLFVLNKFLKKSNSILFLKTHPLSGDVLMNKEYSHIVNISNRIEDTQELLPYIDALISDYSSILFDFALTKKPIVFYCYDYEQYISLSRNMYYDYFNDMPGPFAKTESQLLHLIRNIHTWHKDKIYQQKYEAFVKRFHTFRDSKSSDRLYTQMLKYL